jgi:hypothetical protein
MSGGQRGQATVEALGALPIVLGVAFAAAQLLATGVASVLADHAAEAGAVALLEGGDAAVAARASLPGWAEDRVTVAVRGRVVRVRLRPPAAAAAVGKALEQTAEADAGEGR